MFMRRSNQCERFPFWTKRHAARALVTAKLRQPVLHEAMTTGRRYGGAEASAVGIVDEAAEESQVRARAIERAASQASKGEAVLKTIKQRLYREALTALRAPIDWS